MYPDHPLVKELDFKEVFFVMFVDILQYSYDIIVAVVLVGIIDHN
jgi:hypothetical protein